MIKRILIIYAFTGLVCSFASSASALAAYSKKYCVYVSCTYDWGKNLTNAQGKSIVRTAEFAGSSAMKGAYYLNNFEFNELADECNKAGMPIVGGLLYGKNAEAPLGLGIMWKLLPANEANRNLPDGPSIVQRDPRCQEMEE